MALQHSCGRCGLDLSRRRALPDPHYGLAVVVCPRCTLACVRTRPEAVAIARNLRRGLTSAGLLAVQALLAFLLFMFMMMCLGLLSGESNVLEGVEQPWRNLGVGMVLVSTIGLTGIWLGSAFPHTGRTWRGRGWAVLLWGGLLSGVLLMMGLTTMMGYVSGEYLRVSGASPARVHEMRMAGVQDTVEEYAQHLLRLWVLLLGVWGATGLGVLGRVAHRVLSRGKRRRIRKQRRQLRMDR